ncbi:MAG: hypothetical protein ABI376_00005, partial [Caulobacteraceae bacterium]
LTPGRINADLTIGVDVNGAVGLRANTGLCSRGVSLHGAGFIVTPAEAEHLGLGRRPGLDSHVRPYRNGRDLTGRSRGKLVIDLFGLTAEEVRERFPEVYQHLAQTVRVERTKVSEKSGTKDAAEYLAKWWLFGKPRQELRPALDGLTRYIATVETAKHRTFQFLDAAILPDNKLIVSTFDDPAVLAVLSSSLHKEWYLRSAGMIGVYEEKAVYVKSRCFDPFPFPAWTPEQHAALAEAGERLDAFRKARLAEHPDLTLTRLYNALEAHRAGKAPGVGMSAEEGADFDRGSVLVLAELHAEIDALTLAAYGWPSDLGGDGLLGRLVALNAERAAEEARGQIRWLRPLYQGPRAKVTTAGPEHAGDLIGAMPAAPAGAAPWPKDARTQVLAIKGLLAEGDADPAALAARFKGRAAAADIRRLLAVLQRDGQVRRAADGSYGLLRAA